MRFRRKEKVHYVMSEEDGKPSGWEANWTDGDWVVTEKKKAVKKKKSAKKRAAKKTKKKA